MVIQLFHPSDPRFLLVRELPERVTMEDLRKWRFGKPLLFAPMPVDVIYDQPDGPGTPWVRR
jgi:hypothetical protein